MSSLSWAASNRFVESEAYVQNFGFEWNVHALTQLDTDSSDQCERTFRSKASLLSSCVASVFWMLDVAWAGYRTGLQMGATVVGVDLSRAVDAAQRNIGSRE